MDYLKAALSLKSLIAESNKKVLNINRSKLVQQNTMFLQNGNKVNDIKMAAFTNDFVLNTLKNDSNIDAFVITDIATMKVKGKNLTYFLYKGYHSIIEKGLVYYQVVNEKTLEPVGDLLFSNLEDNIFFKVDQPDVEESSCNAIETGEKTTSNKGVAFLIGNIDQDRLIYDIQRLLFDTCNNVQKHQGITFSFIVQVSVFGSKPSEKLIESVKQIDDFAKSDLFKEYPNCTFKFEFGEE